ncbi:hypothetical protein GC176_23755 [bacterium]|nr:hypothetical protein [bacterium]
MAWFRIHLSDDEQATARERHAEPLVRLLVRWARHCGLTREEAAWVAGEDRRYGAAVRRDVSGRRSRHAAGGSRLRRAGE